MRFWTREVAGWLLVAVGLFIFYTCFEMLVKKDPRQEPPRIIEAAVLTPIGFIVFRGGIHLLKVAVAARICTQTQEGVGENRSPAPSARRAPVTPSTSSHASSPASALPPAIGSGRLSAS